MQSVLSFLMQSEFTVFQGVNSSDKELFQFSVSVTTHTLSVAGSKLHSAFCAWDRLPLCSSPWIFYWLWASSWWNKKLATSCLKAMMTRELWLFLPFIFSTGMLAELQQYKTKLSILHRLQKHKEVKAYLHKNAEAYLEAETTQTWVPPSEKSQGLFLASV